MPVVTDKTQFDCIPFRKYVRLFDSSSEGERHAALSAALRHCAQRQPPLLFFEAAALAFGGSKKELDALNEKASALQAERDELVMRYQQLEGKATELADQVLEATRTIEQLSARQQREEQRGSHNFKQLVADLWEMPQIRLLLVSLVGLVHLVLFPPHKYSDHFTADLAFGIPQIYLFCKWISKQYQMDGPLQLMIKMFLYFFGPVACLLIAEGYPEISNLLVGNEATTLSVLLVIFTTLAVSRLAEWLVEDVGGRLWNSEPLQVVRRCF